MSWRRIAFGWMFVLLATVVVVSVSTLAVAQEEEDPPPSTIGTGATSGIMIDADGVLRHRFVRDPSGRLQRQRIAEARASLDRDIAQSSELRKVSLTRLEVAVKKRLDEGMPLSDAMRYLAGLTRIQYVFYYPETRDIVVAGPAEGWAEDLMGRGVGLESGRPVLELQDLAVALRAFPPNGKKTGEVSCSIDPTPEGLARMQEFLRNLGTRATPADTDRIVHGLRYSLGMQTITIQGISPNTHFAEVMVEADYRMKLIGIGLLRPAVRMKSFVQLADPATVSRNALQRWYFVPNYECVRLSDDELAMELVGDGVKLVGEDEVISRDGSRRGIGKANRASQMFTTAFTKKYPQLAAKEPVYAQLRNLIDLLVATAFIQDQDLYGKAGWSLEVFGSETTFPVETANAPKQVATAVNSLWKGNQLMTPVGGGVKIQPREALVAGNILPDESGGLDETRQGVNISDLPKDKWWWD